MENENQPTTPVPPGPKTFEPLITEPDDKRDSVNKELSEYEGDPQYL